LDGDPFPQLYLVAVDRNKGTERWKVHLDTREVRIASRPPRQRKDANGLRCGSEQASDNRRMNCL